MNSFILCDQCSREHEVDGSGSCGVIHTCKHCQNEYCDECIDDFGGKCPWCSETEVMDG